ncbi:head-tail joining protein [Pararhodobacter zhoushanensis]|uniref:Head-tail adaptor n=1 Tax=Pararhodobacter zhoushanensis TaxID=2479545 RepID=A0ABT3H450_9RHOB|nr:hypothetical protein [Pararhodobacter zhoushanensis]MCW1934540.1 hypothetical protein [Pararhodobacter zhoushanensis]
MTSLFDGMSGIAAAVLGSGVPYTPQGGSARVVKSILRRTPVRAIGPDGVDVLITAPTWRVRRNLVPELARDDRVSDADGTLRVLNIWPQGSPAPDAHLICELEVVAG